MCSKIGRATGLVLVVCGAAMSGGCLGRLVRESVGAVTGAAGKVVDIKEAVDLTEYKGLRVDPLTVSPGLSVANDMPTLIQEQWVKAGDNYNLPADGMPALVIKGEIIHYEMGGAVDQAIGPLQEVIVRSRLIDARSGTLLGEANLIGRAKATTESGKGHLAEGEGKALRKWFKQHGLKAKDQKDKDKEGKED